MIMGKRRCNAGKSVKGFLRQPERRKQSTMTNAASSTSGKETSAGIDALENTSGKEMTVAQLEAKQVAPGRENRGRWTDEEHQIFIEALEQYGKNWRVVAGLIGTRTVVQVRTHAQKYFQKLVKKHGGHGDTSTAAAPRIDGRLPVKKGTTKHVAERHASGNSNAATDPSANPPSPQLYPSSFRGLPVNHSFGIDARVALALKQSQPSEQFGHYYRDPDTSNVGSETSRTFRKARSSALKENVGGKKDMEVHRRSTRTVSKNTRSSPRNLLTKASANVANEDEMTRAQPVGLTGVDGTMSVETNVQIFTSKADGEVHRKMHPSVAAFGNPTGAQAAAEAASGTNVDINPLKDLWADWEDNLAWFIPEIDKTSSCTTSESSDSEDPSTPGSPFMRGVAQRAALNGSGDAQKLNARFFDRLPDDESEVVKRRKVDQRSLDSRTSAESFDSASGSSDASLENSALEGSSHLGGLGLDGILQVEVVDPLQEFQAAEAVSVGEMQNFFMSDLDVHDFSFE